MNSMTGFGRGTVLSEHCQVLVELSGVNRKQVEIALNLPRTYTEWETALRSTLQSAISRGRVNLSVTIEPIETADNSFILHDDKLTALLAVLQQTGTHVEQIPAIQTADLLRTGIIESGQTQALSAEQVWPCVQQALQQALQQFLAMRATEGSQLKADLLTKLATLQDLVWQMAQITPHVAPRLRDAMLKRLTDAGLPVDLNDERIIREIALFADKCDVSEELSRLDSHFEQFLALCHGSAPAGRPLDFLCQEIFRELNTLGSKANYAALSHLVVASKTELEKIREQVQNIE